MVAATLCSSEGQPRSAVFHTIMVGASSMIPQDSGADPVASARAQPISWEENGSYADESATLTNKKSYEWQHTVSDVLNGLIKAGLVIQEVREYPHLPWKYVKKAEKGEDGNWRIPGDPLPQLWSVEAVKRRRIQ